jgi:sugar phosphate isomerase/epimerase
LARPVECHGFKNDLPGVGTVCILCFQALLSGKLLLCLQRSVDALYSCLANGGSNRSAENRLMERLTRRGMLKGAAAGAVAIGAGVPNGRAVADSTETTTPPGVPKFKLGTITYMVGANWDLPTLLGVCKKVGIAAVELRTGHKHGVELALPADQRKEVRKQFQDSGVVLWGLGSTCEFQSPDPAIVKQNIESCKQWVQLAQDVGAKGVKVRPNALPKEQVPIEKTLEQIGKSLIPCGEAGEAAGVEIWVEVHGKDTAKPENMKQILEHCGHKNVGCVWNSNGEDIGGDHSIAGAFKMLRPWIRSCHINDLWKDMLGGYPYRELFRLLRETGYDRYTMCEVPRTPVDAPGAPVGSAGEDFLRYYKALWTELARG